MKEVYRTPDPVRLSLARHYLAENGIEAIVFDEHAGRAYGSIGALSPRLMVADDDAERALGLLKDFEAG